MTPANPSSPLPEFQLTKTQTLYFKEIEKLASAVVTLPVEHMITFPFIEVPAFHELRRLGKAVDDIIGLHARESSANIQVDGWRLDESRHNTLALVHYICIMDETLDYPTFVEAHRFYSNYYEHFVSGFLELYKL